MKYQLNNEEPASSQERAGSSNVFLVVQSIGFPGVLRLTPLSPPPLKGGGPSFGRGRPIPPGEGGNPVWRRPPRPIFRRKIGLGGAPPPPTRSVWGGGERLPLWIIRIHSSDLSRRERLLPQF